LRWWCATAGTPAHCHHSPPAAPPRDGPTQFLWYASPRLPLAAAPARLPATSSRGRVSIAASPTAAGSASLAATPACCCAAAARGVKRAKPVGGKACQGGGKICQNHTLAIMMPVAFQVRFMFIYLFLSVSLAILSCPMHGVQIMLGYRQNPSKCF
jgi:hypothetical protein